jgi:hypothetical protein
LSRILRYDARIVPDDEGWRTQGMRFRSFSVAVAAGVAIMAHGIAGQAAPINDLAGRWSGWGSITMASGATEQVKCVATYFVEGGGAQVKQNLRCASTSYKIDATAKLNNANGHLTGEWEEKTYAAVGAVAGRFTGNGFNVSITGPSFSAAMAVTTTNCKQSISITPTGFDISRISIGLDKC